MASLAYCSRKSVYREDLFDNAFYCQTGDELQLSVRRYANSVVENVNTFDWNHNSNDTFSLKQDMNALFCTYVSWILIMQY